MLKKLLLGISLVLCITTIFAQNYPEKAMQGLVNDFTGTLSPEQIGRLDDKLKAFEDSTTNQIAVVLINTLDGREIIDYGVGLIRTWGIGTKEKSNGVLVLVVIKDRKISIQTGNGLEGALTDITTHEIIQNDMQPKFRAKDYLRRAGCSYRPYHKSNKRRIQGHKKSDQQQEQQQQAWRKRGFCYYYCNYHTHHRFP
jgi:uncharacterized protein